MEVLGCLFCCIVLILPLRPFLPWERLSSSPGVVKGVVGCQVCVWEGEVADRKFPRLLGQVPWPEKQWVGFLTEMPLRLPVAEPGVPA